MLKEQRNTLVDESKLAYTKDKAMALFNVSTAVNSYF